MSRYIFFGSQVHFHSFHFHGFISITKNKIDKKCEFYETIIAPIIIYPAV